MYDQIDNSDYTILDPICVLVLSSGIKKTGKIHRSFFQLATSLLQDHVLNCCTHAHMSSRINIWLIKLMTLHFIFLASSNLF